MSKSKHRRARRRRARRGFTVDIETYCPGDMHAAAIGTEVHRRLEMAVKRTGQPVETLVLMGGDLFTGDLHFNEASDLGVFDLAVAERIMADYMRACDAAFWVRRWAMLHDYKLSPVKRIATNLKPTKQD